MLFYGQIYQGKSSPSSWKNTNPHIWFCHTWLAWAAEIQPKSSLTTSEMAGNSRNSSFSRWKQQRKWWTICSWWGEVSSNDTHLACIGRAETQHPSHSTMARKGTASPGPLWVLGTLLPLPPLPFLHQARLFWPFDLWQSHQDHESQNWLPLSLIWNSSWPGELGWTSGNCLASL